MAIGDHTASIPNETISMLSELPKTQLHSTQEIVDIPEEKLRFLP